MRFQNRKANKQREEYQKKKVQPKKSMRGQAETKYGEIKKPVSFSLTPTAMDLLKEISRELGISTSEFIERIARGEIQVNTDPPAGTESDLNSTEFSSV